MLACICGGVIELLVLGAASALGVSAVVLDRIQCAKRNCQCKCHKEVSNESHQKGSPTERLVERV
jgi:hypothetical protein